MKKIFLFTLFANLTLFSKAQNVNETINFINDAIMESTKSVLDLPWYAQIKVNEKGKIITDTYMNLVPPNFTLMESRTAYLKNLKYTETKFLSVNGTNQYVIILKCIDGSNCVSRQVKTQDEVNKVDEIAITVYTKELSEKVKTAILHLLTLANANSDFLTKDIF